MGVVPNFWHGNVVISHSVAGLISAWVIICQWIWRPESCILFRDGMMRRNGEKEAAGHKARRLKWLFYVNNVVRTIQKVCQAVMSMDF